MKSMNHETSLIIPVCVDDERDLYDGFDPNDQRLSDSFRSYLADFVEDKRLGERVRLELTCSAQFNMERFQQAYRLHIERLRERKRRERLRKTANALRLLGIGIVFVLIGIAFSQTMGEVTAAIVSTIGSFAIWEASAVWIEEMPVIRAKDRFLALLNDAEIVRNGEDRI